MAYRFIKLSTDITKSTIWAEDDATLRLWIWLLASADREGVVRGTIPGIANAARVTIEACKAAMLKFEGPDEYSGNPARGGQRIERVEGGWRLINYNYYRNLQGGDPEWQAERHRRNQKKYRDKKMTRRDRVGDHGPVIVTTEAEAEAELNKSRGSIKESTPSTSPVKPTVMPGAITNESLAGTLPLIDGSSFEVTKEQLAFWQSAYPGIKVREELIRFKVWCDANRERRKTRRGIKRAVVTWLSRAQDRSGNLRGQQSYDKNVRSAQSVKEHHAKHRYDGDGPLPSFDDLFNPPASADGRTGHTLLSGPVGSQPRTISAAAETGDQGNGILAVAGPPAPAPQPPDK